MNKLEAFLTILAWVGLIASAVHLPLKYAGYRYHGHPDRMIFALQRGIVPAFRWKLSVATILASSAWLIAVYWS